LQLESENYYASVVSGQKERSLNKHYHL